MISSVFSPSALCLSLWVSAFRKTLEESSSAPMPSPSPEKKKTNIITYIWQNNPWHRIPYLILHYAISPPRTTSFVSFSIFICGNSVSYQKSSTTQIYTCTLLYIRLLATKIGERHALSRMMNMTKGSFFSQNQILRLNLASGVKKGSQKGIHEMRRDQFV